MRRGLHQKKAAVFGVYTPIPSDPRPRIPPIGRWGPGTTKEDTSS